MTNDYEMFDGLAYPVLWDMQHLRNRIESNLLDYVRVAQDKTFPRGMVFIYEIETHRFRFATRLSMRTHDNHLGAVCD